MAIGFLLARETNYYEHKLTLQICDQQTIVQTTPKQSKFYDLYQL